MSIGIWNSLDELGVYLGLDRLPKEDDDSFKTRLYQVSRYMYKNDPYSIIKSISAQCGLQVKPLLKIESNKQFKISINYDYLILETENEYIRKFIGLESLQFSEIESILSKVADIETTRIYDPRVLLNTAEDVKVKHIVKTTNTKIGNDFTYSTTTQLSHENIILKSVEFEDVDNYAREVDSLEGVMYKGDYFLDYNKGFVYAHSCSSVGQIIKYKYIENPFIIEYSELALTPIGQYFKYGITKDSAKVIEFLLHRNTWS